MPATQRKDEEKDQPKQDTGNDSPEAQVAEAAGISEGEVHGLRQDAGLNQLPGNEANTLSWENSAQGKAWIKDAKAAEKDAEKAAKETHKDLKDGQNEAERKFRETVSK